MEAGITGLDVHVACDNLATHKTPVINEWLGIGRMLTPVRSSGSDEL